MGARGDSKPGLTAVHALAQANVPTRILDSLAPNHATSRASQGANGRRAARKPPYPATDRRWDAPPSADEGATRRTAPPQPRSARFVRKQVEAERDPKIALRGSESSRVRPDHALCCIAPAVPSDRHRPPGSHERKLMVLRENATPQWSRVAKGVGTPGRGSFVAFTRYEASRPWLITQPRAKASGWVNSDRGVRRGSSHLDSAGRKRPLRARPQTTTSAQRRRETPSAPVRTGSVTSRIRVPD